MRTRRAAPHPAGETRLASDDRGLDGTDALDLAFEHIARDDRADARRRAGHDQIAGLERHELAEIGDSFADGPDLVAEIAGLAHFAVDLERDGAGCRMTDGADGL